MTWSQTLPWSHDNRNKTITEYLNASPYLYLLYLTGILMGLDFIPPPTKCLHLRYLFTPHVDEKKPRLFKIITGVLELELWMTSSSTETRTFMLLYQKGCRKSAYSCWSLNFSVMERKTCVLFCQLTVYYYWIQGSKNSLNLLLASTLQRKLCSAIFQSLGVQPFFCQSKGIVPIFSRLKKHGHC